MYVHAFFYGLTFTWEVCAPRPTGSKATDDGLDFLPPEGTGSLGFRVKLGFGPLVHYREGLGP